MRNIICQQLKKRGINNSIPSGVNNQLEEIQYFNAYLLPISEKASIQEALDTHGSIRLERGDYSGVPIVIKNNQKLYGHPTLSIVTGITIQAGSTNVKLIDLLVLDNNITFQSGLPITHSIIKNIKNAGLIANGAKIENCTFMNIYSSNIKFDFSETGYYRNNKFIKIQSGGHPSFSIKGNNVTPSYGNVHLWSNFLTPPGDTIVLDTISSVNFVGIDAEMWNSEGQSVDNKSMFYATNMGDVKLADLGGGGYSDTPTGAFDIQADNLFLLHNVLGSLIDSKVSSNTDVIDVGSSKDFIRNTGTVTGFKLKAHYNGTINEEDILYNNVVTNTLITDETISTKLSNSILGTQYTPWIRPTWEILPDPLGANWRTERIGKPDSRAYIQNLIDTNGVAELPEGIFYISSSLIVHSNDEGIIGAGTGKTVIVGLTDDFPLITMRNYVTTFGTTYYLAYLTLQGGSKGQFFEENYVGSSFINKKFVIYRDQEVGIHLYKMGGTDNCFWDSVSFVNCETGFYQEPKPITDNVDISGYVDKVVFYNNQYINCGIAVSSHAMRANNMNMWLNCKFDGNETSMSIGSHNYSIVANSDFTNTYGEHIIRGGDLSMYNCDFYNNPVTKASMRMYITYVEGCNFLDNVLYNDPEIYQPNSSMVVNSTIRGNILNVRDPSDGFGKDFSVFINSRLLSNPTLSKMLVNFKNKIPTVILDSEPNPYPQLLVTQ